MKRRSVVKDARSIRCERWALGMVLLAVVVGPVIAEVLQYGDGTADGKKSFGGGGHLVMFDAGGEDLWLNELEMFGSRYGTAQPPDEDFTLYIVDEDRNTLRKVSLPYLLWQRGEEYWRELPIPPLQVPRRFGVGLTFDATRTKGVFVGTDTSDVTASYSWTPGSAGRPMEGFNWMVRATIGDEADGDPEARDLVILRDGEAFFDRLVSVQGADVSIELANREKPLMPLQVASIRIGAITAPLEAPVTIVLTSGMEIACAMVSVEGSTVRILDATGDERELSRAAVARIEFD